MKLPIFLLSIFVVSSSACLAKLSIKETAKGIEISNDGQQVLFYHKAIMPPPEGQPKYYERSGFIHPLCSPSGGVLTGIHPADHIHHMGLWHAWVETEYDGRNLDFWNLDEQTATIRYARTLNIIENKNRVGFKVRQNHVALAKDGHSEEVILEEDFTILVGLRQGTYFIDHRTEQTNVARHALELPAYRYGGPLAYRCPPTWNKDNSGYLTSTGLGRDGHATRADWCAVWGPTEEGNATLVFMGRPDNRDAPQRMRIWPETTNNGAVFFNWVPIQEFAWSLEPGVKHEFNYRLLVFDGKPDQSKIEQAWKAYSKPK
ncbi:MAG: PmoA family protein [Verrucomicrobiae bacterium]|nr:PmoA family protein [Verrucomicrobiae bacterium]